MADMTSAQGALYELQASGYHFSRDHSTTSDEFMALLVALGTCRLVRMITNAKTASCDKSDAEILNSLKDWVSSCDVDFKREALKKIDSAVFRWPSIAWQRLTC